MGCSLVPRPHPDFISQEKNPIILHGCEIKSGWGLGTRLDGMYTKLSIQL